MGILDKLKKIFLEEEKQAEKSAKIEIEEKDIDSFLKKKEEEIEKLLEEKAEKYYGEISIFLDKMSEDVEAVLKVNIDEKKADGRIKEITKAGQRDYVRDVKHFINAAKEKKKSEEQLFHIQKEFNKFMQASAKSYIKATQLIGKEITIVRESISKIRELTDKFSKENSEIIKDKSLLSELIKKNNEKKSGEFIKEKLEKDIETHQTTIKKQEKEIKEIETKITETKKSSEYKEKETLKEELEKKQKALEDLKFQIRTLIDKKILEKYIYIELDIEKVRFVKRFVEDPVNTLISDSDFQIIEVLRDLKDKIKREIITIKNPEKIVFQLGISQEEFQGYKDELERLSKEIIDISHKLSKITPLILNPQNLEKEKENLSYKILETKRQLEILDKKHEEIIEKISDIIAEIKDGIRKYNY